MRGSPNTIPRVPIASASSMTLAACSSALEGMQPTFRQTPPRSCQRSTSGDLEPEVGGAERRSVAAGAGAEHQQLGRAREALRAAAVARLGCRQAHGMHRRPRPGAPRRRRGARGGAAAAARRSRRGPMSAPLETLSPRLSSTSVTVPAVLAGRPSRPCRSRASQVGSPARPRRRALTSTSTTGTSLKSPMSGTDAHSSGTAAHGTASISARGSASTLASNGREARRHGAVDHAVIVGERQRQHQSRHELPSLKTPAHAERDTPRMATSGALMIGVKAVPPMPPRLEMVKLPPCISAGGSLPARAFADIAPAPGNLADALAVGVTDHRHQQAVRCFDRDADVEIALVDELSAGVSELLNWGTPGVPRPMP